MTKNNPKLFLIAIVLMVYTNTLSAQISNGTWNSSGGAFSSWFNPLADLMIGIGAVVFLLGGIKTYNNMQLGTGNPYQESTNLFGGSIFLIIIGITLRVIFF